MKVLVVDDEDDTRRVAVLALSRAGGLQVVAARDGAEALRLAAAERPDLVLLDVMMPELDGPAVLERLRRDPATAGLRVAFLTAKVLPAEVARLQALGAVAVIAKPYDVRGLAAQVKALIAP